MLKQASRPDRRLPLVLVLRKVDRTTRRAGKWDILRGLLGMQRLLGTSNTHTVPFNPLGPAQV